MPVPALKLWSRADAVAGRCTRAPAHRWGRRREVALPVGQKRGAIANSLDSLHGANQSRRDHDTQPAILSKLVGSSVGEAVSRLTCEVGGRSFPLADHGGVGKDRRLLITAALSRLRRSIALVAWIFEVSKGGEQERRKGGGNPRDIEARQVEVCKGEER